MSNFDFAGYQSWDEVSQSFLRKREYLLKQRDLYEKRWNSNADGGFFAKNTGYGVSASRALQLMLINKLLTIDHPFDVGYIEKIIDRVDDMVELQKDIRPNDSPDWVPRYISDLTAVALYLDKLAKIYESNKGSTRTIARKDANVTVDDTARQLNAFILDMLDRYADRAVSEGFTEEEALSLVSKSLVEALAQLGIDEDETLAYLRRHLR